MTCWSSRCMAGLRATTFSIPYSSFTSDFRRWISPAHSLRRETFLDFGFELFVVEGLGQIAKCSPLHRLDRVGNAAVRGQNDDGQAGMNSQQLLPDIQSVFAAETQIGNGEIEPARLSGIDGFPPGGAGGHDKSHRRQSHLHQLQQTFFVLDYENLLLFHENSILYTIKDWLAPTSLAARRWTADGWDGPSRAFPGRYASMLRVGSTARRFFCPARRAASEAPEHSFPQRRGFSASLF